MSIGYLPSSPYIITFGVDFFGLEYYLVKLNAYFLKNITLFTPSHFRTKQKKQEELCYQTLGVVNLLVNELFWTFEVQQT